MPPYIICADKTLIDMCIKLPFSKEAMLDINGIGENKYEKYGERFLSEIAAFTGGNREHTYYEAAGVADEFAFTGEITNTVLKSRKKQPFTLTREMAEKLEYKESAPITAITNQLNDLRDEKVMKKISGASVIRRLMAEGYLDEQEVNGVSRKTVFQKGEEMGIELKTIISEKGIAYMAFYFNEAAQKSVVQKLLTEWRDLE